MNPRSTAVIKDLIEDIAPVSETWRARARQHLDMLTKPLGSLGRLEDLAAQMIAIRQEDFAAPMRKAVYIFAADHGITVEGVSAYPREVTHQMVLNFLGGGAAINVLARMHHVDLHVVDVGVDSDFNQAIGMHHYKIGRGTRNMLHEPAMSDEHLTQALTTGAQLADEAAAMGHTILALGEMGIGNTTSASAITCALTGAPARLATGRGTGLDAKAHAHKVGIVEAVMERHFAGAESSPLACLGSVGGFEIAAMTGMALRAAQRRIAVVADGFISTAAVAIAAAISPSVGGYLFAGHRSQEPGHALLLEHLGLTPILTLDMRLGEGTGAVLAMPILESAMRLYTEMATFASAGVSEAAQ